MRKKNEIYFTGFNRRRRDFKAIVKLLCLLVLFRLPYLAEDEGYSPFCFAIVVFNVSSFLRKLWTRTGVYRAMELQISTFQEDRMRENELHFASQRFKERNGTQGQRNVLFYALLFRYSKGTEIQRAKRDFLCFDTQKRKI